MATYKIEHCANDDGKYFGWPANGGMTYTVRALAEKLAARLGAYVIAADDHADAIMSADLGLYGPHLQVAVIEDEDIPF